MSFKIYKAYIKHEGRTTNRVYATTKDRAKAEIRNHTNLSTQAEWEDTDPDYNDHEELVNTKKDTEVYLKSIRVKGTVDELDE